MTTGTRRTTIYLGPEVHKALRLKAAETSLSVSELVNDAVSDALAEDAEDLAAFEKRRHEPTISFEDFVRGLRRDGKI